MAKSEAQKKSLKQEKRITKSLKELGLQARRQHASGGLWFAKSDVVTNEYQIEAKTKVKPSKTITMRRAWLEKVEEEAFLAGKTPALVFNFGEGPDYFVLKDSDFYNLLSKGGLEDG